MKIISYIFVCILTSNVLAQVLLNTELFNNPTFQNYTMKNGLLSNYITDITQDGNGYIWASSYNGLIKYSGSSILNYQLQSKNTKYKIPSNNIVDLFTDYKGNVWINSENGIFKYDLKRDSILLFNQKKIGWGKVYVTKTNNVFITQFLGVEEYKIINDSLHFVKYYSNTINNSIDNIIETTNNVIYATSSDNPSLIHIDIQTKLSKIEKLYYNKTLLIVKAICNFNDSNIIIGTIKQGVFMYNTISKTIKPLKANYDNISEIRSIEIYKIDNITYLIIGSTYNGIYIYQFNNNNLIHIKKELYNPNGIIASQINNILIDKNKGIWLATDKGISYFHPSIQKIKTHFLGSNNFENISVNTVLKIQNNNYLVGTNNIGLYIYNSKYNTKQKITNLPLNATINKIFQYSKSTYLIATNIGIFEYNENNNGITKFKIDNYLQIYTFNIVKLNDTLLGFCSQLGGWTYNIITKKAVFIEKYIKSNEQSKMYCKDMLLINNKLWIMRFFNGIEIYDLKSEYYTNVLPSFLIKKPIDFHNICKTIDDVYISSSVGIIKINIQNPKISCLLNNSDGLEGDNIENVIYSLNNNQFYYSTITGVYNYNLKYKTSKILFTYENYTLKWINQFSINNNQLLITVADNFIEYNLNYPFKNRIIPNLEINEFTVNNVLYKLTSNYIKLKNNKNNIRIKLDAICYPENEKNTWLYYVKGFDNKWQTSKTGYINLYNLPVGTFNIFVYSINNEGYSSKVKHLLKIRILNPFYKTWWFYLIILSIIGFVAIAFFNYKKNQLEKLQTMRNQISRDLHDELGANVSAINIMSQLLKNNLSKDETNTALTTKISTYSVEISNTINDIVWNINPNFDTTDALIKKMMVYSTVILESAGIDLKVKLPTKNEQYKLKSNEKYNLYLIYKECINNAAKHSKATKIKIVFEITNQLFSFKIVDNGVGFDLNKPNTRNGLYNLRTRAAKINAALHIQSKPNIGTQININYKL